MGRPGAFFSFRELLRRNSNSEFSGISTFPERNLSSKKFFEFLFEFLFRSGISRSEIEFLPTEEHEGVRIGSGGNPKMTNDDEVNEVSNSSNRSVFFRSEKAEDF